MKTAGYAKLVGMVITLGLILPPLVFWMLFSRTPSVSPNEAKRLMQESRGAAIFVDVRTKSEFEQFSLLESVHIPYERIKSGEGAWRRQLENKQYVFVICNSGVLSAVAADRLIQSGISGALNVEGGLDAWISGTKMNPGDDIARVRTPCGEVDAVPRIVFSLFEQITISVAAFGVKPLYTLLSLIIAAMLWKSAEPDLAALRRSMIAFFLGENACAANFLVFGEKSELFEFFHVYGMLVCFGFASYAFLKALDIRIIKFTVRKEKCALLPLCKTCYKYQDAGCNLRILFQVAIPAAIVVACMPLTGELGSYFYVGRVFWNDVVFGHPLIRQVAEARLYPLAAIFFFTLSFAVISIKKEDGFEASKILFALGLGPLGFSLMRFILFWSYSKNPLWAEAWEELTELLYIVMAMWIVLRIRAVAKKHAAG